MFRRRSRDLPALDAPLDEHLDAIAAGTDGAVVGFIRALADMTLWQAAADIPPDLRDPATGQAAYTATIRTARTTMPDGGQAAMVSTSAELAVARTPGSTPYGRPGEDVLREVLADPSLDGVVVNPAARWQVLRAQWIAAALDR